jgi:hypothetical protein
MAIQVSGQVGPQALGDGVSTQPFRQGKSGEMVAQELHGRFYEQVFRGNVFSIGCSLTALSAATILLTASAQPIVGVWNPLTSPVNLVILQAALIDEINAATSVALGAFVWAASLNNTALTAGLNPFNRKTLASTGSQARAFSLSTASLLTGLTNNLVVFEAAEFNTASGLLTTTVAAATPTPSVSGVQNFDGSLIIPPGGVLALLNTISVTTHSVAGRLLWEEVPTT